MDLVPWLSSLPLVTDLVFHQRFTTSRPQKQLSLSQKWPAWWQRDDAGGIEADTGRLKKQPSDVAPRSQRVHWTQFISADKYEVIYVYTWRISYHLCPSWIPGMVVGVVTCLKNPLQLIGQENEISASPIGAVLTPQACTAHHNKHFAGNLPALYLMAHSLNQKCALLTLSEMGQAKT